MITSARNIVRTHFITDKKNNLYGVRYRLFFSEDYPPKYEGTYNEIISFIP